MQAPHRRPGAGWIFVVLALLGGTLFFYSLPRLWPLAAVDLVADGESVRSQARQFLESRGFDLDGYRSASSLTIDRRALDYVEQAFGAEAAQRWIGEGLPLVRYSAYFKKRGERTSYTVTLHPDRGVLSWSRWVEDDTPGARISEDEARILAREALRGGLDLDLEQYDERSAASVEQIDRRDHTFGFERTLSEEPELRERLFATVAGDEVVSAGRSLPVPGEARRAFRAAEAPGRFLETLGFILLGVMVLAAFFTFLWRLRDGSVDLGRAMIWPTAVFVCLIGTYALETASLFRYWEPLWPRWISNFQYLSYRSVEGLLLALLLLTVIAAGDSLDRESGAHRGASLWALARGRLLDRSVALASGRGFLTGLLCGGTLAAVVILLQVTVDARTTLQPRGFFFYTLNTASPAATSLLFFFGIALAEELGYRFFGGTWMLRITHRRWLAILVPAVIYGLTHTRLDFLPPADPWWARAVALSAVGCVWGWAFFRFDALTVVLSHFTADLFIFNWPRLASGDPRVVAGSAAVLVVPLLPALLWLIGRAVGRQDPPRAQVAPHRPGYDCRQAQR